jgi:hypothetical protein
MMGLHGGCSTSAACTGFSRLNNEPETKSKQNFSRIFNGLGIKTEIVATGKDGPKPRKVATCKIEVERQLN